MASTQGKSKGRRTKGVTVPLQTLLAEDTAAPQGFSVVNTRKVDWAESMENEEIDDTFTLNYKRDVRSDKIVLPTAPKSSRGPDVDMERVPTLPPFKAYLGNLPFDVTESDIAKFFSKLNLKDVRLPHDNGRAKGFGYAEFNDRQSLIDALMCNGQTLKTRSLRVGLTGENKDGTREVREDKDRTAGDWRSARDDNFARDAPRDGYNSRNGGPDRGMQRNRSNYESSGGYDGFSVRSRGEANDRGFDRVYDKQTNDRNDRSGNRYGRSNRTYDRNHGNYDMAQESYNDKGYDRQDSQSSYERQSDRFVRRFEERKDSDYKYQNERRSDRNYSDRRGNFDDKYERSAPSPPPQREEDVPRERPKLQLKPRSKPIEEANEASAANSAIFGDAKPVNTAAREKQIEEKLQKEKEESERKTRDTVGTERVRRISSSSNASANSRSRKGSESGPQYRDFDDDYEYRSNTRISGSLNNRHKPTDRTDRSDSGPKQILRRPPSTSLSSRNTQFQSNNQKFRNSYRGTVGSSFSNSSKRRDRIDDNKQYTQNENENEDSKVLRLHSVY